MLAYPSEGAFGSGVVGGGVGGVGAKRVVLVSVEGGTMVMDLRLASRILAMRIRPCLGIGGF